MDYQYSIVNQCLQLLKQSDMPTIKKLRVEIQLIQMKRLLLSEAIPKEAQGGVCAADEFEGLLIQMRRICGGNCENDALASLMDRLGGMLLVLGGDQLVQ